jgi:hypothetical protein
VFLRNVVDHYNKYNHDAHFIDDDGDYDDDDDDVVT